MFKITLLTLLIPLSLPVYGLEETDFLWLKNLKKAGISEVNVCGDPDILNTKKSLKKDFLTGTPLKGFVFSKLPSHANYWQILKTLNKDSAKEELKNAFSESTLWEVSADGVVTSLGHPTNFDSRFTATVKDCVEGAAKTIGGNCNALPVAQRSSCCSEKFTGPEVRWTKGNKEFTLFYSPDPSVRLKVYGEKSHRYCHVVESISF